MVRPLIRPATLARAAATNERAMPSRCDIWTNANPRVRVYANRPCRVGPIGGTVGEGGGGDRAQITGGWAVALPLDTDVQPEWHVVMADDDRNPPHLRGKVFVVGGDVAGSYATARRVYCEEAQ